MKGKKKVQTINQNAPSNLLKKFIVWGPSDPCKCTLAVGIKGPLDPC